MKLTKYEHACFTVELDGNMLVVDPGDFTSDFTIATNVIAVIITHEHQDHLSNSKLQAIADKNPDVVVIGHADTMSKVENVKTRAVVANEGLKIGPFELQFYGGTHATIHTDIPLIANLGVMINNKLYYPGDSYTVPEQPVQVLAVPIAAPWMKISEAIDFVRTVKPVRAFPTHDALLSDLGKSLPDRLIPALADGVAYQRLQEPIDI